MDNNRGNSGVFLLTMGLILVFSSCASRRREKMAMRPLLIEKALTLKGQSLNEVQTQMGQPVDHFGTGRYYWFLSLDSPNTPEPTPVLHEFIFIDGKLANIRESK